MITATQARQLAEGDHLVRQSMADLHVLLRASIPQPHTIQRIRSETQRLYAGLVQHFALQELDGYLDQVVSHAPHLHERVRQLHKEQHDLVRELETVQDEIALATPAALQMTIQRRLDGLLARIEDHEARKNKLVLSAFNTDPGALD